MKLEIGYNHSFEIRREKYLANCKDDFSILYLSDLHLNSFSKKVVEKIAAAIKSLNPTIILLGGDYVDSKKGLAHLNSLLASVSSRENVFAIAGNHDYFFGVDTIKEAMLLNNVNWIENGSFYCQLKKTIIKIDTKNNSNKNNNSDFSILLLHKPINITTLQCKYNIAFAGHLHGCQFVFWQWENKLFPGAFFYKRNLLKAQISNCKLFISKGLGDTLPIRFNCKKDMIFVEVTSNK